MSDPASTPADPPASAASLRINRAAAPPKRSGSGIGIWILGILVVGVVGAVAWSFFGKATGALGGTRVREGVVVRLSPDAAAERTTASGYVTARTRAAISPKYPGKLARLLVDVGDLVEAGQLLAELEHAELDAALTRAEADAARAVSDAEAASRAAEERKAGAAWAKTATASARISLDEAKVRREDARREADRQERMLAEKVATESERDRAVTAFKVAESQASRAESDVRTAEAEETRAASDAAAAAARAEGARHGAASAASARDEARVRREDASIRAPFKGRVLRKEAEVGEVIAPASTGGGSTRGALLTLADFSTLEMEVDVFERDVSLVEQGAPCRIVLDAYGRSPFAGRVRQLVPTADRQKATVQVKVAFDAPDARVLPEMGGKVVFLAPGTTPSGGADWVFVPGAALVDRGGAAGVFVLEKEGADLHVRWTIVGKGERDGDRVVALSGVSGGERVVVDPAPGLKDGERVFPAENR